MGLLVHLSKSIVAHLLLISAAICHSNGIIARRCGQPIRLQALFRVKCIDNETFHYPGVILRQVRLNGHVARLPAGDPTHRILSCLDPSG